MASDSSSGSRSVAGIDIPSLSLDTTRQKAVAGVASWVVVMVVLGILTDWHSIAVGLLGGGYGVVVVIWLVAIYFSSEI